jgi:hypothetical protein
MSVGLSALNRLDFVLRTPKASAIIQDIGDSNILLRFFGWVDQTQTDFLKGRSLAIQAVKSTLEAAGFALPEPIYRLRFDDSAPASISMRETGRGGQETRSKAAHVPVATPIEGDTLPDAHVAELVQEERAAAGDDDLLDEDCPIE